MFFNFFRTVSDYPAMLNKISNDNIPVISPYLDAIVKYHYIERPNIDPTCISGRTKEVPLTQGLVAVVDEEMLDWLNQWKWHAFRCHGGLIYAGRMSSCDAGKRLQMHRSIIDVPNFLVVDHINGNGLDNRLSNLRSCTMSQNCMNTRPSKNTNSGYKGVNWNCGHKKWLARIMINGKHIILGWFDTPLEGAIAYNRAAIQYYGEFANLNVLPDSPRSHPPVV